MTREQKKIEREETAKKKKKPRREKLNKKWPKRR